MEVQLSEEVKAKVKEGKKVSIAYIRIFFHKCSTLSVAFAAYLLTFFGWYSPKEQEIIIWNSAIVAGCIFLFVEVYWKRTRFGLQVLYQLSQRPEEKLGLTNSTYMYIGILAALCVMKEYWHLVPIMLVTGVADPTARIVGIKFGVRRFPGTRKTFVGSFSAAIASILVLLPFFRLSIALILGFTASVLELIEYDAGENGTEMKQQARLLAGLCTAVVLLAFVHPIYGPIIGILGIGLPRICKFADIYPDDNFRLPLGMAIAISLLT